MVSRLVRFALVPVLFLFFAASAAGQIPPNHQGPVPPIPTPYPNIGDIGSGKKKGKKNKGKKAPRDKGDNEAAAENPPEKEEKESNTE